MCFNRDFILSYPEMITLYEEVHEQIINEHLDNSFEEWMRYNEVLLERLQNLDQLKEIK